VPAWHLDWQVPDRGRRPNTIRSCGADLAGFRASASAADVDQFADVDRDLPRGRARAQDGGLDSALSSWISGLAG